MSLRFFNTLTGEKDEFKTLAKEYVTIYTCGPTVYDYAHIGNFRSYVFEDLLRRYLQYKGFAVKQVMNLTDVDDKTISGALQEGVSLNDYTKKYIAAFFEDLAALFIQRAEYYPRATEHINEIINLIGTLVDRGYAYERDGSVYFNIAKFKSYGKLSKKPLEDNIAGFRIDSDEYEKQDSSDFVLWKKQKEGEPAWDSPYGKGRPGWHIECSAMSMKYLGPTFDIHAGGEDLIFPHHENEIAQSEGATGKQFVRYWLHCKFLLVENEKMSKSKGNFYTLRDLLQKGYSALAIRYLLLSHNYRHPLNFTFAGLEQAHASVMRLRNFILRLTEYNETSGTDNAELLLSETKRSFEDALDDDLNIAQALASLFEFTSEVNKKLDSHSLSLTGRNAIAAFMRSIDRVLGMLGEPEDKVPEEIHTLIADRTTARKERRFQDADMIRNKIKELGWILEDTPQGPRVTKAIQ